MSDIRDFLSWFDGFCENIKQRPSAEQWAKVVERIRKIEVPPPVAAAPPKIVGVNPGSNTNSAPQPKPVLSKGVAMSAGP